MKTGLDFLSHCLNALNRIGEANAGAINLMLFLITLRMFVLQEKEALREQQRESQTTATRKQIEQMLTTAVARIVAVWESTATRTSQAEESLTVIEALPSMPKTHLPSPLPQFLPLRATPGGVPLERCLPLPATWGGV